MGLPLKTELTAVLLRELLHYDSETGMFTWLQSLSPRTRVGGRAGSLCGNGGIYIQIRGVVHAAHRLAWLYVTGEFPKFVIDHKDGDRTNNRIDNLRDVTLAVNRQNERTAQKRNRVGFLGVTKARSRYRAHIGIDGKNLYLGSFATAEEAHRAYLSAKRDLHPGCLI